MTELYWISKTVVIDWALTLLDGTPAAAATVTGTVTLPDLTTAPMIASWTGTLWRLTYDPPSAGLHAYAIDATGAADDHEEGTFTVQRSPAPALPITLDPTTSIGRTRLLVTDVNELEPVFSDAQYTAYLGMNGGYIRLAAAQAFDTIAASEVLTSKVIKTQDLQTDGAKVAAELRAQAANLRAQHDDGWGNDGLDPASAFTVVDFDPLSAYTRGELAEISPWWLP